MQTRSRVPFLPLLLATASLPLGAPRALADDAAPPPEDDTFQMDKLVVTTATRTEKLASALPMTTTVVTADTLDRQFALSGDIGQALAQFIPSYAPSRQKLTSRGESFRGRDPLYLVDGIPQSNPLRAGNRESLTVDPFFLEKIEVVHGSSASQGLGATGGIVNFVTQRAPEADGTRSILEVGGTTSSRFKSDGYGGKVGASVATRQGAWSAVVGATAEHTPMAFDGDGRLLGVDNTQGDTLDSDTYSFFGKLGASLGRRHSLELMVNHFNLEQNLDWVAVAGNRATGLTTTSAAGEPRGRPARNNVTSAALTFTDRELFAGELTANVFLQDFSATYGASDTPSTRNSFRVNGVPTLDQSQIEADKRGARVTWVRTFADLGDLGAVTGFDYLDDKTEQVLVLTGRSWVPPTTYEGWSPYLQLEKPFGPVTLHGGVRYEFAQLDVDDFTTIESAGSTFVRGGSPTFEEPLFNLGATWRATPGVVLFGGYTQGFGMPDVGRVLRAINIPGQDVDDFIDLQPVVTDNWETGARFFGEGWKASASVFYSTSELGARLVANSAGIFDVVRERTEIYGLELTGDVRAGTLGTIGGYFALVEGKSDTDEDGAVDYRMPGVNITAPKLALYWDRSWTARFATRVQSLTLLDRSAPNPSANPSGDFDSYTLIDVIGTMQAGPGELSLGVENVFDQHYITYYSQTLDGSNANNFNYFAGRGRTLSVRYRFAF
ncbi:MAG TPA: TonB-dependent receptor [Opitutaceae bacterium]